MHIQIEKFMANVLTRKREKVYEYQFEIAPQDGKICFKIIINKKAKNKTCDEFY